MQVKIIPIITENNIPVSNFKVIENEEEKEVGLSDMNGPLLGILSDISQGSITPTTIKNRTFFQSTADPIFTEHYEYKENSTVRFGINISNSTFREQLITNLTDHNKALQNKLSEANERSSNISGASKYQEFCPKYIKLTEYENMALAESIGYMNHNGNKTVLVDIFPREFSTKNGIVIGGINVNDLDTHTVLLYRTTEGRIFVIDPNSPMFSSHINQYEYDEGRKIETLCSTEPRYKIYSRPEKSDTGFDIRKFRDCSDIAAKLSFLLNQDQNSYQTIDEIMNSDAVKLITNNYMIDGITFKPQDLVRLKQSSDIEKIINCNTQMQEISEVENKKAQEALALLQRKTAEINAEYKNSLEDIKIEHEKHITDLLGQYNDYINEGDIS